jgi:cytochrome c-type biogenesis protein CcmE
MKLIHWIGMTIIAGGVGVLSLAARDVSTYATVSQATQSAAKVKIAGQLVKSKPIVYEPQKDANRTMFTIKDQEGVETEVVLLKAKPQDFEMSEQVVCTGEVQNGKFIASDVLLKCPSKYKDDQLKEDKK